MSKQPIKVAMIGGGINSAVGRVHEIALKMDNLYSLDAGCFSRNAEVNRQSATEYGVASERTYADLKTLLDNEADKVDVLVVTTPIDAHKEHINAALDRGLKVITDKPLLATKAECADLLKRVKPETCDVFSIFNYTGYPAVREMKHRIEQGQIGQVFKIMAEMPQDSYMRLKNQGKSGVIQQWRLRDGEIPCLSLDLFVHLHSLIHFLTASSMLEVSAHSRSVSGVKQGLIDEVDALIRCENNLYVNAWYGKAALGMRNGLRLRLFGTQGSFEWYQEEPEQIRMATAQGNSMLLDRLSSSNLVTNDARYNRFKPGHPSGFIEAFANYYADVATAMQSGQLNEYTLSVGTAALGIAAADAIQKSSITGQAVDLMHSPVQKKPTKKQGVSTL